MESAFVSASALASASASMDTPSDEGFIPVVHDNLCLHGEGLMKGTTKGDGLNGNSGIYGVRNRRVGNACTTQKVL